MSSEIPPEIVGVISNLAIIAGLPSGSKLNSCKGTYAAADSWIDNFWRWVGNESSEKSLDFINNTITEAIRISKKYPDWQSKICEYVVQLEKSVINLTHVYRKEPATLAQIEIIKLRITKEAFNKSCIVLNNSLRREYESSEPIPINGSLARSAPEMSLIGKESYEKIDVGSAASASSFEVQKNSKNKK